MLSKKAPEFRRCFKALREKLSFPLLAINTDSGSDIINSDIINFMSSIYGQKAITFSRSRPYKKNYKCYGEQRNFTDVRSLFGNDRFEQQERVVLTNEIYRKYWNPLN